MRFRPKDLVKSCPKLESGLRFGPEGVRACQLGPFAAPVYWTEEEAASLGVTKEMIIAKRRELFEQLNDDVTDVICKKCSMVETKCFAEVDFSKLGRIDHAPRTICNLRCNFCGFTQAEKNGDERNGFVESKYDSLKFLKVFDEADVQWDAAVDFNGGETSLLKNLQEYLDYFRKMKITILCFTNGVKYSEGMASALADGIIQWLVVSVDAGTSSTYKETKRLDVYPKVLENITKYASKGGAAGAGSLAVKYIFTPDNCSDDDVYGFVYAMLAIQPQKVWLTFDFTPFGEISPDGEDFLHYDFTRQIKAYAKMYVAFRKHGLEPVHYTEGHLAKISKAGRRLLREALHEIDMLMLRSSKQEADRPAMLIGNFRSGPEHASPSGLSDSTEHLYFSEPSELVDLIRSNLALDAASKCMVALAPATPLTRQIAEGLGLGGHLLFFDKNVNLHGRKIASSTVHPYEDLARLPVECIFIVPPEQHHQAIRTEVLKYTRLECRVFTVRRQGA